ncbi:MULTISPECIES: hypothetical protein [Mycobacterium]|nr:MULTISPECIES: hypothetical protein [Mycobacterium]MDP7727771.1 hypothetical protein [Mycobacterium sp. TY813]
MKRRQCGCGSAGSVTIVDIAVAVVPEVLLATVVAISLGCPKPADP